MNNITMKEILQNGGKITFSYKEKKEDWISEVSLHVFLGGWGLKPKYIVQGSTGRIGIGGIKEFPITALDEAVKFFHDIVMTPINLWYKHYETILKMDEEECYINLENEVDYKKYEKIRLSLIEEAEMKKDG